MLYVTWGHKAKTCSVLRLTEPCAVTSAWTWKVFLLLSSVTKKVICFLTAKLWTVILDWFNSWSSHESVALPNTDVSKDSRGHCVLLNLDGKYWISSVSSSQNAPQPWNIDAQSELWQGWEHLLICCWIFHCLICIHRLWASNDPAFSTEQTTG